MTEDKDLKKTYRVGTTNPWTYVAETGPISSGVFVCETLPHIRDYLLSQEGCVEHPAGTDSPALQQHPGGFAADYIWQTGLARLVCWSEPWETKGKKKIRSVVSGKDLLAEELELKLYGDGWEKAAEAIDRILSDYSAKNPRCKGGVSELWI
jgi:hypothetical protein